MKDKKCIYCSKQVKKDLRFLKASPQEVKNVILSLSNDALHPVIAERCIELIDTLEATVKDLEKQLSRHEPGYARTCHDGCHKPMFLLNRKVK